MREIKIGDKYLCKTHFWSFFRKDNIYEIYDFSEKSVSFMNELGMLQFISNEHLVSDFTDLQENKTSKPKNDPIVSSVMFQLAQRSILGQRKYGTTLEDNNADDFLQHFKEELMDAILYIEKIQSKR